MDATVTAEDEVVGLLSDLIRINTSNPTHPERPAAEWVAAKLDEVGIASQILEAAPGRASTVARIQGSDPRRPPLRKAWRNSPRTIAKKRHVSRWKQIFARRNIDKDEGMPV